MSVEQNQLAVQEAISSSDEFVHSRLQQEFGPDAHKLPICFKAAELIVGSLADKGFQADHVISVSPSHGQHSYAVLRSNGEATVIDPTWQQFLPASLRSSSDAPKTLIGSPSAVKADASNYGVPESALNLWNNDAHLSIDDIRESDRRAEAASDAADENGRWAAFAARKRQH